MCRCVVYAESYLHPPFEGLFDHLSMYVITLSSSNTNNNNNTVKLCVSLLRVYASCGTARPLGLGLGSQLLLHIISDPDSHSGTGNFSNPPD